MRVYGLDHIQLAMPRGEEARARHFYGDVLGLTEVPKPANLAGRGGVCTWACRQISSRRVRPIRHCWWRTSRHSLHSAKLPAIPLSSMSHCRVITASIPQIPLAIALN